ncbi:MULTISPECIES: hypothetical protein [unclassified Burkholderia]|uniref:hypothetical protein n=1 Tax=unclassified Burkholderia TaxID=2613784 RepID=UPI00141DC974|nr:MULTISPECIES: hypothetical protein [unclassified Burkholderia]NIE84800.1 hypothetical protein [Burkholderia sp. Tr-860]NIF63260.1 hypothetical protein [Burkholderia sp. Cy-647]NIF96089.1 hypothetical protein [Burkholderia sp. Ax-1720]
MRKTAALLALACTTLSACGGDGDGASTPLGAASFADASKIGDAVARTSGNVATKAEAVGNGAVLTPRFAAFPFQLDKASFLTLVNSQGAKGFRYLGSQSFLGDSGNKTRLLFVNDGSSSVYTYELQSAVSDQAGLLAQLNAQGARGYRYDNAINYGTLYRKDDSSATYAYQILPRVASTDEFLVQANTQGQSGYGFVSTLVVDSNMAILYMKNSASNAVYGYHALPFASWPVDVLAQENDEGAQGYRARSPYFFGTETVTVYMKDLTQASSFRYEKTDEQPTMGLTSAGFVAQANARGAQGYGYYGDLASSATMTTSIYFQPSNCAGFLCTTLDPLTQN